MLVFLAPTVMQGENFAKPKQLFCAAAYPGKSLHKTGRISKVTNCMLRNLMEAV